MAGALVFNVALNAALIPPGAGSAPAERIDNGYRGLV
jgi:hypothetical protein